MKIAFMIAGLLLLAGCSAEPVSSCSASYIAARNKVDMEYKAMVDDLLKLNDPKVGGALHPHLLKVADGLTEAYQIEKTGCPN